MTASDTLKKLKYYVLEYTENGLDRRFVIGSCDTIEKSLQLLEILLNSGLIEFHIVDGDYYLSIGANYIPIDKEMFDMISEVLHD